MAAFAAASNALFYPPALLTRFELTQLAIGNLAALPDVDLDVVAFEDESGGSADRELAIALLADMDEVVVDAAELQFAARSFQQQIDGYGVTNNGGGGADAGIVLRLDAPGSLRKIVIDDIGQPLRGGGAGVTIVVRPAQPKNGGGFDYGPPIFAHPSFSLPSSLYAPILGGLGVSAVAGGHMQLEFPGTSGSAWLIQLATGDEATKLTPQAFASAVHSVTIDAAARDLTLVVPGTDGAADTLLWNTSNPLTAAGGTQVATFTPVAQKQLTAALQRAAGAGAGEGVTLPIALRFSSSASGRIGITSRTLAAHYRVHPLAATPAQASLRGGWTPLRLSAPAARRPSRGTLRVVARHLGRELNDGSPVPPPALPSAGVLVDASRTVAAAAAFQPRAGEAAGSTLELVSVNVALRALAAAEVALEVRADAAGGPGAILAPAVVRQLAPGDPAQWVAFELAAPLAQATGCAPLWISLRTTQGAVHWFAAGPSAARASADGGATWAAVDPLLQVPSTPLAQLFHAVAPSPPELSLRIGDELLPALTLAGPAATNPSEFSLPAAALGTQVLEAIGARGGSGRVDTDLLVFSRAVADLTIAELTLDYDPPGA